MSISEPVSLNDAKDMLISGFIWFLKHQFFKTLIFFAVCFGAPGYIVIDWYKTDRVTIKDALPMSEAKLSLSIMPKAYALGGEPILIEGKVWGYYDPAFQCWKLAGEDGILVYDKITKRGWRVEMPNKRLK